MNYKWARHLSAKIISLNESESCQPVGTRFACEMPFSYRRMCTQIMQFSVRYINGLQKCKGAVALSRQAAKAKYRVLQINDNFLRKCYKPLKYHCSPL